jgi:asparagine synthase (glutamine-hydrolysing)
MCGITGFVDFKKSSSDYVITQMVETLNHRGPEDRGAKVLNLEEAQVGLGHTRLSIIDLSTGGHQPMKFQSYTIVFNGEIYNYKEIREQLLKKSHEFQTNSDTEVILHAYAEWGKECVNAFIGMFAFVIFDEEQRKLIAFRDRVGVKPFYYYRTQEVFLFASELKAFHQHPKFEKSVNQSAVRTYFDLGYIPAPHCIFENTYKLNPGSILELNLKNGEVDINKYWDPVNFYEQPKSNKSFEEVKEDLHDLLCSSFKYRMVSDVPVGIFLSGGYDSTAVAAILQKESNQQLKTFTIGFESGNNEAPYARETANYLDTDHYEYTCTTKEAQDIIPQLPYFFDEPFADSSAIPTMLVSKFAKEHVTVALSADGGDELFAGYNRYEQLASHLKRLDKVPGGYEKIAAMGAAFMGNILSNVHIHKKHHLKSVADALTKNNSDRSSELYKQMHLMPQPYHNALFNKNCSPVFTPFDAHHGLTDSKDQPLLTDFQCYLPDDILTKVDRATMAASLEGREPFLDHRLLEFAAQLPYEFKTSNGISKLILKEVVHQYVPKEMLDRPKAGFSIPLTSWFLGDLNQLLMDTLSKKQIDEFGILNYDSIAKILADFNRGKLHYKPLIWKLLMFQMWCDKWINN